MNVSTRLVRIINANGTVTCSGNTTLQTIAFSAKSSVSGGQSIISGTDVQVDFTATDYNDGSGYSVSTDRFTAPTNGVYHFDAMIMWASPTNAAGYLAMSLKVNSSIHSTVRVPTVTGKPASNMLSTDVSLNAGDIVSLTAFQTTGEAQLLFAAAVANRFDGRLVIQR